MKSKKQITTFKRFDFKDLSEIKLLKSSAYFNIFTALLSTTNILSEDQEVFSQLKNFSNYKDSTKTMNTKKVFLVTFRYIEYTNNFIENLILTTKFLKVQSEYILNKIGYVVNLDSNSLSMIYEHSEGKVMSFEDFNNLTQDKRNETIIKINIIYKMINLVRKLDNIDVTVGYFQPYNFIYNPDSSQKIIMIEPFIFKICQPKDPISKSIFGLHTSSSIVPEDSLMSVLLILKVFSTTKYSYEQIVNRVFKEITLKKYGEDQIIKSAILEIPENPISELVNKNYDLIKNTILKLSTTVSVQNSELLLKELKSFLNNICNDLNKIMVFSIQSKNCEISDCINKADEMHKINFKFLCKKHLENFNNEETVIYDINKLRNNLEYYEAEIADISKEENLNPYLKKLDIHDKYFRDSIYPSMKEVQESLKQCKYRINLSQDIINSTFSYHKSHISKFIKEEFASMDGLLADYQENLVTENKVRKELENLDKHVLLVKNFIEDMNSKSNYVNPLQKLRLQCDEFLNEQIYFKDKIIEYLFRRFISKIKSDMCETYDFGKFLENKGIPCLINITNTSLFYKSINQEIKEQNESDYNIHDESKESETFKKTQYTGIESAQSELNEGGLLITNKILCLVENSSTIKYFNLENQFTSKKSLYDLNEKQSSKFESNKELIMNTNKLMKEKEEDKESFYANNNANYNTQLRAIEIKKETKNYKDLLTGNDGSSCIEKEFRIHDNSKYVFLNNRYILITGGHIKEDVKLKNQKSVFLLDLSHKQSYEMNRMINGRGNHAICLYDEYFIIVAGGKGVKTCEKYDLLLDKWISLPDLPYEITDACLFVRNKNEVYLLGGKTEQVKVSSNACLMLDMINQEKGWHKIDFETEDVNINLLGYSGMGIINDYSITNAMFEQRREENASNYSGNKRETEKEVIFLLGGIKTTSSNEKTLSDKIILVDLEDKTVSEIMSTSLSNPCYFKNSQFLRFKFHSDKYYNFGCTSNTSEGSPIEVILNKTIV